MPEVYYARLQLTEIYSKVQSIRHNKNTAIKSEAVRGVLLFWLLLILLIIPGCLTGPRPRFAERRQQDFHSS